jgi:hypothetical protein
VSKRKFVSKFKKLFRKNEGREHARLVTTTRKHDFAILSSLSNRVFVLALVLSATLTTCFPRGDLLFLTRKQKIFKYANAVNARNRSVFVVKNGRAICTPLNNARLYTIVWMQQIEIMYFNTLDLVT